MKSSKAQITATGRHRGQVFILHTFIFFTIFEIFLSSFLSFLILSLTRLHAWDTPDSPTPEAGKGGSALYLTSPQRHREHRAFSFLANREMTIGQNQRSFRAYKFCSPYQFHCYYIHYQTKVPKNTLGKGLMT